MVYRFDYDIIEDEICPGTATIDPCDAQIYGTQTTNLWDVDHQCLRTVTALMFRSGNVNYGKIGMTVAQFADLCCEGCGEPDCKIFTCEFDCVFK